MLRFNIHKLEIKVGDSVLVGRFEDQGEGVSLLFTLEYNNVVICGTFQDLGQIWSVDTEGERFVATVEIETFRFKKDGTERNVRRIHGLDKYPYK
jgi:hypothetical protein